MNFEEPWTVVTHKKKKKTIIFGATKSKPPTEYNSQINTYDIDNTVPYPIPLKYKCKIFDFE